MLPCENSCQLESAADKTRVGDFFSASPDCAGQTGTQVVDCDWEMEATATTPRQSNSLPKKEKEKCAELRIALSNAENARGAYTGQGAPGFSVKDQFSYESGLSATLFKGPNGQEVLAIRGTEVTDWGDLRTNWDQAFGNVGAQYSDVEDLARGLRDRTFSVAGHSLGGGLASVLGTSTGRATYTFNAAGIHQATMDRFGISATAAEAHVTAYSVRGELLTSGQLASSLPNAIGNPIVLNPDISFADSLYYFRGAVVGGLLGGPTGGVAGYAGARASDLHSIEESIESIRKALNENDCD